MSLIRDTYFRFLASIHEIGKFGIAGFVSTIITFGVQNALYGHVGPTTAVFVANAVATGFAFLGNRYWAFRHRKTEHIGRETVQSISFAVIDMLIQAAFVDFNHYILHNYDRISFNVAIVIGVGLTTLFRFYRYRTFVSLIPMLGNGGGDTNTERSNISHKHLSPEEARRVASDEHLRAEWANVNTDISMVYELLGPPPLKTLSGTEHGR